mgnify:CR=1 FL=1
MKWPWKKRQVGQPDEICDDERCKEIQRVKELEELEEREREVNRRIEALENYAQALKGREDGSC